MKRTQLAVAVLVVSFLIPASVQAGPLDSLYTQIEAALRQLTALRVMVEERDRTVTNETIISTPARGCPALLRTLERGSKGDDVAQLQEYLASQKLLTGDSITGFFGPLTETALQRWQSMFGIVKTGSPASTGYGVAGPRTRTAIALACANSANEKRDICPVYKDLECPSGQHLEPGLPGLDGCRTAPTCVPGKAGICPVYIGCPTGMLGTRSVDAKGCSVLTCTRGASSTPTYSCPILGTCPTGYIEERSMGASGCPAVQCKLVMPRQYLPSIPGMSSTTCPTYSACPAGAGSTISVDAAGCTVLRCAAPPNSLICPTYVSCRPGFAASSVLTAEGCTSLSCTALPSTCPVYENCPTGYRNIRFVDAKGCPGIQCGLPATTTCPASVACAAGHTGLRFVDADGCDRVNCL